MFHTLAWTVSAGASTLTDLTPVPDQIIPITNNHYMPGMDLDLFAAVAMGTDLQRVRIDTPRLRQLSLPFIRPIQPTLIGANDANHALYDRSPFRFRGQEEIRLDGFQDNAGAQRITVVAFVGNRLIPVPRENKVVIRGTSTTAVVANVWSSITYTLDQNLPAGAYTVGLIEHISANGQAVRATFDQQFFRPGAPSISDVNQRLPYWWTDYSLGSWGDFVTYSLPRLEVLANAADAVHEIYIHLVPTPGNLGLAS